jgi:hypothetical protein
MGRRPAAPGTADQRNTKDKWKFAEGDGWQHGRKPNPPSQLTDAGKRAWRTWFASWWASYWDPSDLPGLELCVRTYDAALSGHIDVSKAIPLMDRYGITPDGRFRLRWARQPAKPAAEPASAPADDEVAKRRKARAARVS